MKEVQIKVHVQIELNVKLTESTSEKVLESSNHMSSQTAFDCIDEKAFTFVTLSTLFVELCDST